MTNETDPIPAATAEWFAQSGDARRMTLPLLRQRRFWLRALVIGLIIGVIATTICIATGSGLTLGLIIGACFCAGAAAEVLLIAVIALYRHNRISLFPGARWGLGADADRLRIDNPVNTVVIERTNITSVEVFSNMVIVTVLPKRRLGIPAGLFDGLASDSALADLID